MKKLVKVEFLFEGVVLESEIQTGVLIGNRVLVANDEGTGLYNAYPSQTDEPGVVLIDLDNDGENFLNRSRSMLLDLVIA